MPSLMGRYFKPTIWNKSLHEIGNDNGIRLVNFAISKILGVKSTMFPHRNIHKYTWTSPGGKTHNQIEHILEIGLDIRMYLMYLTILSWKQSFFFKFPNLFAICIHNIKYNQQIVC
jgi:hypothetical protein